MASPDDIAAGSSRLSRLQAMKLAALVRDHVGHEVATDPRPFPPGAAVLVGDTAWVLLAEAPERRLGSALALALRAGAADLQVIAEAGTGTLARRAGELAFPITVWHAEGRTLLPAFAESITPPVPPADAHLALVDLIVAGGATPVVEHGVVTGEVRGLEVCRVVDDPHTGAVRLEVGVRAHDREAFLLVHGDVPTLDALAGVVQAVEHHRGAGVDQHPLNRLAAERFLRWRLEQDPGVVGAAALRPGHPPLPRPNVKDPMPCVAEGTGLDGRPVVVVCSTGVDLDVVPYALDARLAAAVAATPGVGTGEVRTVIALPARDRVPVTEELARLARQPLELVSVD